ncbi:MAG: hypothetical protein A2096_17015 [Spirochaetes bacterium GWF1_41_5]|nr:MAG: hypothetical protein A2096_17015 [Spirochaetes bacterium GWF1_41_5]HBE00967.1 hypothetical protein [Spirochaetia bacterium]
MHILAFSILIIYSLFYKKFNNERYSIIFAFILTILFINSSKIRIFKFLPDSYFNIKKVNINSIKNIFFDYGNVKNNISEWKNIQLWCEKNIPLTEKIIIPPYKTDFRIFSRHPIAGTYKDGTVLMFDPNKGAKW